MIELNNLEERLKKIIEEKVVEIRENEEIIRNKKTEIAINEGYISGIQMAFKICKELENEEN